MRLLIIICFIISGFISISAQERYVKPIDEAKNDASFVAFREGLISAVRKKDAKYLIGVLDRDIKVSFGGDAGIEDFKKSWKINEPNSMLWNELLTVLTNGGKFSKAEGVNYFSAPYSFDGFPADLDAFEHQVIFGSNINLRSKTNLNAEIVATLSYNVVKVDYENSIGSPDDETQYVWLKVETLGGKKGFVSAKYVRSPIAHRAIFEKKGGRWKMTAFIAGD